MPHFTIDDCGHVTCNDPCYRAELVQGDQIKVEWIGPPELMPKHEVQMIVSYETKRTSLPKYRGPVHVPGDMHPNEFKKSFLTNRNEGLDKIRQKHRRTK